MKQAITLSFICLFVFYTTNAQWRELGGTMSVRLGNTTSTSYSNDMAMDDSGNVFICGDFLNSSMEYFISQYNKKTNTWAELGGIATGGVPLKANFPVGYLLTDHKGNVYATGGFTNSLGNQYLAKWTKLTNSWTSVGTIIPEGKILKDNADNIYVNSSDTTPSGRGYDYIAKWDGLKWSMFGPPSFDTTYPYPIEGPVSQIAIDDLGRVYAYKGSVVMTNNGIKWSDTTYFPTSMGFLSSMAVDPDRNVYLGTEGSDLTNSVYKINAKTKVINVLCSKMPTFPVFPSCSIASIAAVSSSEVYVAGNNLIDTFPQLQIAKWSKVTNEWTKVGSDSGMISGLINTLIIDTQGKSGTILASGYLYNNNLSTMEVKQFVGEYAQQCNAFFTLLPSGVLHTYTLINYAFGAGKLTYKWNWGDGSPLDTGVVPSHTYKSAGNYQICVEIKDSVGCSSSFCTPANSYLAKTAGDMVYVNVVKGSSINLKPISIKDDEMRIFPNPAQNTIIVEGNSGEEDFDIFITDLTCKTILKEKISTTNGSFRCTLNLNNLSSGLYFLLKKTQSGTKTYKIVKE